MGETITHERRSIEDLKSDPATLDTICLNVANGGSLIELCRVWQQPFAVLMRWIRADSVRLKSYQDAIKDRDEWTRERIMLELRSLALSDIREAFDSNGKLLHPTEWPDSVARAIAGLDILHEFEGTGKDRYHVGDTHKIKLWDKTKNLELIGKSMAMFIDRTVDHSGDDMSMEELLAGSWGKKVNESDKPT